MRAIDTNVLVRLITEDDARQTASAEAFIQGGAWVSTLVLTETIWVLSAVYDRNSRQLSQALVKLLQHTSLTIQDSDVVAEALALFQAKPSLGFSDCLILQVARKAGHLPLGTFDRALAKAEGAQKL